MPEMQNPWRLQALWGFGQASDYDLRVRQEVYETTFASAENAF